LSTSTAGDHGASLKLNSSSVHIAWLRYNVEQEIQNSKQVSYGVLFPKNEKSVQRSV